MDVFEAAGCIAQKLVGEPPHFLGSLSREGTTALSCEIARLLGTSGAQISQDSNVTWLLRWIKTDSCHQGCGRQHGFLCACQGVSTAGQICGPNQLR
jgi:hypothetical protein